MFQYIKDVRSEMRHVSWPSRTQTIIYTIVVVAVSVGVALYLGLWDYVLSALIRRII
jgi:preprotein translocase subunit SecE